MYSLTHLTTAKKVSQCLQICTKFIIASYTLNLLIYFEATPIPNPNIAQLLFSPTTCLHVHYTAHAQRRLLYLVCKSACLSVTTFSATTRNGATQIAIPACLLLQRLDFKLLAIARDRVLPPLGLATFCSGCGFAKDAD